jgi:predicted RNA-binding protein with PUA-like domain
MDVMVTLPSKVKWEDYEQELGVAARGEVMNYRVSSRPKELHVGDRCFVVHKGQLKGWMRVVGIEHQDAFTCTTTGKHWPADTVFHCDLQPTGSR